MLFPYHHKPEPIIRSRRSDPPRAFTFGVEDEVDKGDRARVGATTDAINDLTDRVYCKHDSSIPDGFEIVSHPGTLAHHMYEMPWRGILAKAKKAGYTSHDAGTCGLHIHVGRDQLGATDEERDRNIRKIIVLVVRYQNELFKYSRRRREDMGWCRFNQLPDYTPDTPITDAWAARRIPTYLRDHDDRYVAVNVTNRGTIEFRIFRGTLIRDTLIAALQLVSNICEYAMTHTWDEIQASAWLDVCRYRNYNENDAYLTSRHLAPACARAYNTQRQPNFDSRRQ